MNINPTNSERSDDPSFPPSFIPHYTVQNAVYGVINTEDCFRSEAHSKMFNDDQNAEPVGTIDSYLRNGRLKPVFGLLAKVNGKMILSVIDGNKFLDFAKSQNQEKLFACILLIDDWDEIIKIMAELQRSNHNSYASLYSIIESLWPIFYKGQGYRSDLNDEQYDEPRSKDDEEKKLSIYQKIGNVIGLSGNAVKFIRKIGQINPLHFKQIETTRHSLYAAYLACKNEATGVEPDAPKPKAPKYIRTSTNDRPEFNTTDNTANGSDHVEYSLDTPSDSGVLSSEDSDYIVVRGWCECCEKETNIRISKSLFK